MNRSAPSLLPHRPRRGLLLVLAGLVVAAPAVVRADDGPSLRQGLWEYQRAAGASRFAATECLDPGEELRRHQSALQKIGCKLSPTARAGSTWTYSADCSVKLPSGATAFSTTSVVTADSDAAYQVETRTTDRRGTTSEVITAHRVADCTQ